jgi:hypothetical protein
VSFVHFKKTAIVLKNSHGSKTLIIVAHFDVMLTEIIFYCVYYIFSSDLLCAEKYLLNEHESATFLSMLFHNDFSVILN